MRNYSTLIYFVNGCQSESESDLYNLINEDINGFLAMIPEDENKPSDQVIKNILNFARSYEVYETEEAGYVEMNLN